jgi:hypothetical protein
MTTESYLARRAIYLGMQIEGSAKCKTEMAQGVRVTELEAGSRGVEKKRFHDERRSPEEMKHDPETDII